MSKVKEIKHYLQQHNINAAFITTPDNVFYISGFQSDPHERLLGVIIFSEAAPFLICPQMEVPDVKAAGWLYDVVGHRDTEDAMVILANAMKARGITPTTLAIEKTHLTVERLEALQQLLPHTSYVRLDEKMNAMRVIKDEIELQKLRKAAELAAYAMEVGCQQIAEGKTEIAILTAIEQAIQEKGYKMSFDTMVLSGPQTASPHGKPGARQIQKGDMVLFDLGVIYDGYCSDITRTVAFGEPSEAQKNIYHAVLAANTNAIAAVKPGIRARDLDKIARDTIAEAGYGEYFTHRLGHGLDISVHEFPSITGTNEITLAEGMVFTIEPGIYQENVTGVRIEDDVVVTQDGVEVLTKFPKTLLIL